MSDKNSEDIYINTSDLVWIIVWMTIGYFVAFGWSEDPIVISIGIAMLVIGAFFIFIWSMGRDLTKQLKAMNQENTDGPPN